VSRARRSHGRNGHFDLGLQPDMLYEVEMLPTVGIHEVAKLKIDRRLRSARRADAESLRQATRPERGGLRSTFTDGTTMVRSLLLRDFTAATPFGRPSML